MFMVAPEALGFIGGKLKADTEPAGGVGGFGEASALQLLPDRFVGPEIDAYGRDWARRVLEKAKPPRDE